MSKIQLSQRMYSVLDIVRLLDTEELSIQPKYQRRRMPWPINAKTALMDTVLNNFPLPPIYLRDYVNEEGKRKKEIIDGQQRISTIVDFYKGKFQLSKNIFDEEFYNCTFDDLPTSKQLMIEDFEVSFISIKGASDGDIVSIFSRLNSFSLPLNAQEKLNAKYAGELKTLVFELASDYYTFWTENKILTTQQIARMGDSALVSDILYTVIYGITSSSAQKIEQMYRNLDDEFESKHIIDKKFNNTMTVLGNLFESAHIRDVFKPKFMFFSLFIAVYAKLFGFEESMDRKTGKVDILKTLDEVEEFCINYNMPDFDPALKSKFKQATGNVGQRKFRHEEISKLVV